MESEEEKLRSCFVLQLTINVPVFYYEWRGFKNITSSMKYNPLTDAKMISVCSQQIFLSVIKKEGS